MTVISTVKAMLPACCFIVKDAEQSCVKDTEESCVKNAVHEILAGASKRANSNRPMSSSGHEVGLSHDVNHEKSLTREHMQAFCSCVIDFGMGVCGYARADCEWLLWQVKQVV